MIFGSLLLILVAIVLAVVGVIQGSDSLLVGSIVASLLTAVFLAASARQAAALRLAAAQDAPDVPLAPAGSGGDTAVIDEPVAGTGGAGSSSGTGGGPAVADGDAAVTAVAPESVADGDVPLDDAAVLAEQQPASGVVTIPSQYSPGDRDDERLAGTGGGRQPGDRPSPDIPTQVELDLHPDPGPVGVPTGGVMAAEDEPLDEPPAQLVPVADAALVARLDATVVVVDGRPRYHLASCPHLLNKEVEPVPVHEAVELGFTPCSLCEPDTALLAQARRS